MGVGEVGVPVVTVRSGSVATWPLPVRFTVYVAPLAALELITKVPVRVPVALGVTVTLMVAVPPLAATVVGVAPLTAKSPVVVALLMVRALLPALVSVKATA